jgi:hypothetical protein
LTLLRSGAVVAWSLCPAVGMALFTLPDWAE